MSVLDAIVNTPIIELNNISPDPEVKLFAAFHFYLCGEPAIITGENRNEPGYGRVG